MKTKNLVTASVLLAIGAVLHLIVPGFVAGMKPDFILVTMFFAILLNLDFFSTITIGVVAGILGAVTTTFPGGQIANVVDKILTSIFVFGLLKLFAGKDNITTIKIMILTVIGTLFSGFIFLSTALIISGLPGSTTFSAMILAVVIPAAILNALLSTIIYKTIKIYQKTIS
ncbi:tryptophan transporter [Anaerosphaera multitolerans]|uniref:Tryptophan transporter n=1 Tax=Anaerosphaera multitolerans TaxID=2487351 RepID=A0A437S8D0_9FIRM|nr:tryptophan transporter [Anaerosphaera multitolerans]RVU55164.1 tryptophan transporter [Anaerosphaera multitolerans]